MHSPFELPVLRALTTAPDAVSADLVVSLYAGEPADAFRSRLPAVAHAEFSAALARGESLSDPGHVLVAGGAAGGGRLLVVGVGWLASLVLGGPKPTTSGLTIWDRQRTEGQRLP